MEDIKSAYEIADWSISHGGGATGYGHHTARYAGVRLINTNFNAGPPLFLVNRLSETSFS